MNRLFTATCIVAACAVGAAAQTTGSTATSGRTHAQAQDQTSSGGARTMTLTGCLRAGDTAGTYMLTNVEGMGRRGGGDTGAMSGSTAGTTTTGSGTGSGAGTGMGQGRGRGMGGITLNAESGVDLSAHVGHKIEVTGTMTGGGRRGGADTGAASGATTTEPGATTTATGAQGRGRGMSRAMHVTSVKMVSETCGTQH